MLGNGPFPDHFLSPDENFHVGNSHALLMFVSIVAIQALRD